MALARVQLYAGESAQLACPVEEPVEAPDPGATASTAARLSSLSHRRTLRVVLLLALGFLGLAFLLVLLLGKPATDTARDSKRVFVFRHCVRSPKAALSKGHPDFTQLADYLGPDYPDWPVPQLRCTPAGDQAMIGEGGALGQLLPPGRQLRVYADGMSRDVQSALDLLLGMDRETAVQVRGHLFDTIKPEIGGAALCPLSPETERQTEEAIRRQLKELPEPEPFEQAARAIQAKLGRGRAPAVADVPTVFEDGHVRGGAYLMKALSQAVFYSWASRLGWMEQRNVTVTEMYGWLAWQFYYRRLSHWTSTDAVKQAFLLKQLFAELESPEKADAVFVGHDGDLDTLAMYFSLGWEAPPYCCPEYFPTPPGSGLMFERRPDGQVVSWLLYPEYSDLSGNLSKVPAKPSMPYADWKQLAIGVLERHPAAKACFEKVSLKGTDFT